jgi:hypothetical protein
LRIACAYRHSRPSHHQRDTDRFINEKILIESVVTAQVVSVVSCKDD